MEQTNRLISFDAGIWLLGSKQHAHSIHLYNFPDTHRQQINNLLQANNPILIHAYQKPEITIDLRDIFIHADHQHDISLYLQFAKDNRIRHATITLSKEPTSTFFNAFILCRHATSQAFSGSEKQLINLLTSILIEAHQVNQLIHQIKRKPASSLASAVCDMHGAIKEADATFFKLLSDESPHAQTTKLNFSPQDLLNGNEQASFTGKKIIIQLSLQQGFVLLHARPINSFDSLTTAEKRVAKQLIKGLTNKEIARALNISPKTVSNHLYKIFSKLGVFNRQQAVALISSLL